MVIPQARAAKWTLEPVRLDPGGPVRLATVLSPVEDDEGAQPPAHAYLCLRKLDHDRPVFKVAELQATQEGAEGRVLEATGHLVCMKAFEKCNKEGMARLLPELDTLERVTALSPSESHLVGLADALQDRERVYLITPYLPGGDLFNVIQAQPAGGLSPTVAKRYLVEVVNALLHLKHKLKLAHGDLSLENVVLSTPPSPSSPPSAYVIDLGSCVAAGPNGLCPAEEYHYRGKIAYVPPEVVTGAATSAVDPFAVDVWALGVFIYMLLTGRPLYVDAADDPGFQALCGGRAADLLNHYARFGQQFQLDPLAQDLICSLLRPDPSARPKLEEVLCHRWFSVVESDSQSA